MWVSDFDHYAALADVMCPRCGTVGMAPATREEVEAVPEAEHLPEYFVMCPSLSCRCASCGAIGVWPNLVKPEPEVRRRRRTGPALT